MFLFSPTFFARRRDFDKFSGKLSALLQTGQLQIIEIILIVHFKAFLYAREMNRREKFQSSKLLHTLTSTS